MVKSPKLEKWKWKVGFSPDVSLPAVALPADHLRAHPVGGAGHRHDASPWQADGLEPPAGTEIAQLHVAHWVTQNVGAWMRKKQKSEKFSASDFTFLYRNP